MFPKCRYILFRVCMKDLVVRIRNEISEVRVVRKLWGERSRRWLNAAVTGRRRL